jgi:hypothetical protein
MYFAAAAARGGVVQQTASCGLNEAQKFWRIF